MFVITSTTGALMRGIRRGLAAVAAILFLASLTPALAHSRPALPPELEALRAKLEPYQDPYTAVRDGYLSTLGCVEFPDGGMGVHFVNMGLIGPVPDPMAPSILLYQPEGGKLRLVAVEWLVPLATGITERPRLFGQDFRGPMPGHEPLLPKELEHYDFHAWLFEENPAGLFHNTNSKVTCAGKWPYALMESHAN